MDIFQALPALNRHPLLNDKMIALIGVSTIPCDEAACYFEIAKQKYWRVREGEGENTITQIGVGGIGGSIERKETVLACLRREIQEELGVQAQPEMSPQTFLIRDWQVVDTLSLKPSKKRPTPLMVILVPPRLGGPNTPDHLAIVAFRTQLRDVPKPHDLFGLLRIENHALSEFFARDEWPLNEINTHPGLTTTLNGTPPSNPVLRPTLTARAFQLLIRGSYV
ncbi:MAG: NUDIX domain-containing protein [Chloroflexi bacterium]|nr:NUDIX domain-containing protein [Chloroflexota bacterium]